MTISDAFAAGYDAYWDGTELEDNPFDQHEEAEEFEAWIKGWREALRHDYDESEGRH